MLPDIVNRPTESDDILIMFFHDAAIIGSDSGAPSHPPNSLIIWPRKAAHYYGNPDQAWRHSWTHCDGSLLPKLLAQEQLPMATVIPYIDASLLEN